MDTFIYSLSYVWRHGKVWERSNQHFILYNVYANGRPLRTLHIKVTKSCACKDCYVFVLVEDQSATESLVLNIN